MKKTSAEWWFLLAGGAALALGLGLRIFVKLGADNGDFAEGLCIGLALALFFGGLAKVRRDARRRPYRDSGRDSDSA
ncbi:MAG TPA: hypothetical protein VK670_16980 [Silvibacterium sp.]|nr:hypothetical protein [Silvibacterium sp.]